MKNCLVITVAFLCGNYTHLPAQQKLCKIYIALFNFKLIYQCSAYHIIIIKSKMIYTSNSIYFDFSKKYFSPVLTLESNEDDIQNS